MAHSLRTTLVRTAKEILDRNLAGSLGVIHSFVDVDARVINNNNGVLGRAQCANFCLVAGELRNQMKTYTVRKYSKLPKNAREQESDYDSDSDSDDEVKRKPKQKIDKHAERGDSEFWRRKMRTLHRILDINKDGVISFDDFELLTKKFTDLGCLSEETSKEFYDVMKNYWEDVWGEITPYNLVNAEQFLTDYHHRLNDKDLCKKVGGFLPYFFRACDTDHSGSLDLEQYKLLFRCLGLKDEDAIVSFAVIDKNGDGQLSLKEFVKLGREYFLTENEEKASRMFWGPLIDH